MKKNLSFWKLLVLVIMVVLVVACGQAAAPAAPAPTEEASSQETKSDKPLKFVYVSPVPLGVNEFLIMGQTGLEQAGDKHGAQTKVLESENDPTTREENVRAAINEGATIVIVLGFEFNDIIPKVAAEAPDIQFLIVDQCIENPPANVHCAVLGNMRLLF
jgi:basic membrane lipoprotein Med (substrate-binding protein (PBP1-ABC) superfamily)